MPDGGDDKRLGGEGNGRKDGENEQRSDHGGLVLIKDVKGW